MDMQVIGTYKMISHSKDTICRANTVAEHHPPRLRAAATSPRVRSGDSAGRRRQVERWCLRRHPRQRDRQHRELREGPGRVRRGGRRRCQRPCASSRRRSACALLATQLCSRHPRRALITVCVCVIDVRPQPGLYRFAGNLTIPQGCALSGSYHKVPSHSPPCPGCFPVFAGSVLLPTGGRGSSCSVPVASPNKGLFSW